MWAYFLIHALVILGWVLKYLLIPGLIAFGLYKLIGSDWFGRRGRLGLLAALCVFLVLGIDIVPGNRYFAEACKTEGGLRVERIAEGVEGLALMAEMQHGYDSDELVLLNTIKRYGFVERDIRAKSIAHVRWKPPSREPGIYSYYLAEQETPGCDDWLTGRLDDWIPQGQCLAVERLPDFSARYAHEHGWDHLLPHGVAKFEQRVFDRRSGETLATWRRLQRPPTWSWSGISQFFDFETQCPEGAPDELGLESLQRVLIPVRGSEQRD